jgi:hypothetical protein
MHNDSTLEIINDHLYYTLALVCICVISFAFGMALGGLWLLLL